MGCCDNIDIQRHTQQITVDGFVYTVVVVYCKNCGSLKSTSHIKEK